MGSIVKVGQRNVPDARGMFSHPVLGSGALISSLEMGNIRM
jgi:hypothetical protein